MIVVYTFYHTTGLGDNIRGLITMKQIQKMVNFSFELYVDMDGHPIESFLNYDYKSIKTPHDKRLFFPTPDELPHHGYIIQKLQHEYEQNKNMCLRVETNFYPEMNIDADIKEFMRNFLTLKPEYETYLQSRNRILPPNYNLFHYRLGDKYVCIDNDGRIKSGQNETDICFKNFLHYKKQNSVILSDSLSFKEMCKDIAIVFLNEPMHTRFNDNPKIIKSHELMLDTICDFYLIKNASTVNCYSFYPWISNFVLWTSLIYDVPLFNLRI